MSSRAGTLAKQLLDLSAAAIDPPARVHVAHGSVVEDCEQLTTYVARMTQILRDPRNNKCAVIRQVVLQLVLMRCVATVDTQGTRVVFPTPEVQEAEALALADDAEAIRTAVMAAWKGGTFPADGSCEDVTWGEMTPRGPLGGFAGWTWLVTVQL